MATGSETRFNEARDPGGLRPSTRWGFSRRLRRRIVIATTLVVLFTSTVVSLVASSPLYAMLQTYSEEALAAHATTEQHVIEEIVSRYYDIAAQIGSRTRARQVLEAYNAGSVDASELNDTVAPILRDALERSQLVEGIIRFDSRGVRRVEVGLAVDAAHDALVSTSAPELHGPFETESGPCLLVSSPIRDRAGAYVGCDLVRFSLAPIQREIENAIGYLSSSGLALAHLQDGQPGIVHLSRAVEDESALLRIVADPETALRDDGFAADHRVITRPVRGAPWRLVLFVDTAELFGEIATIRWYVGALIALLSAVGAYFSSVLLRPLAGRIIVHTNELEREIERRTTDLARSQEALKAANADLARVNEDLKDFTHAASHDMKSPLLSIDGYSKLMLRSLDDGDIDDARESAEVVVRTCARAKELVGGIVEFGRVGQVALRTESVGLGAVVAGVRSEIEFLARSAGVRLEIEEPLPPVIADRTYLGRVIVNLVDNAARYGGAGEGGRVRVGATSANGRVTVFVEDDGPGIPPGMLEDIFKPFVRLESDRKGSGIGLAFCRRVVELHSGRIWADSPAGRGARFCVELPAGGAPARPE